MKLLCEDVQLGTAFEDNWCNPRTLSNLVSQINNFDDLDEDKTDLLGVLCIPCRYYRMYIPCNILKCCIYFVLL